MKKSLISLVTGVALILAPLSALAAGTPATQAPAANKQATQTAAAGPLSAGGAAGIKQAQGFEDVPLIWIVGLGAVAVLGIVAVASGDDDDSSNGTIATTTGTGKP